MDVIKSLICDELKANFDKKEYVVILKCSEHSVSIDMTLFCAISQVFRETLMCSPDLEYQLFMDEYDIEIVQDLVKLCYFGEIDKCLDDDEIGEIHEVAKALGIEFILEKVLLNEQEETSIETDSPNNFMDQEEDTNKITPTPVRFLPLFCVNILIDFA